MLMPHSVDKTGKVEDMAERLWVTPTDADKGVSVILLVDGTLGCAIFSGVHTECCLR